MKRWALPLLIAALVWLGVYLMLMRGGQAEGATVGVRALVVEGLPGFWVPRETFLELEHAEIEAQYAQRELTARGLEVEHLRRALSAQTRAASASEDRAALWERTSIGLEAKLLTCLNQTTSWTETPALHLALGCVLCATGCVGVAHALPDR